MHVPGAPLLCGLLPLMTGQADRPRTQELLEDLCATSRVAGTPTSLAAAEFVRERLEAAGWRVEWDERLVLLSLPRSTRLSIWGDPDRPHPLVSRHHTWDPDAHPAADLPPFHSWSGSGTVRARVIDCGHGLPEEFEQLARDGVDLAGAIALCRYGRSYRGVKAEAAEAAGCAGVLMFTEASELPPWPTGPGMPEWAVQRGSIGPLTSRPGDPSTPGWPSGTPADPGERAPAEEIAAALPSIPSLPIALREAKVILARLAGGEPVEVEITVDAPRELRRIVNVLGHLEGELPSVVLAGNHRDAWVRGAHDAGSGTVSLLAAAERLGAQARVGWKPRHSLALAFWDGEETGLIGSTEWGEAGGEALGRRLCTYVNADALVSGTQFGCSGTPGMESVVVEALRDVTGTSGRSLAEEWTEQEGQIPRLSLPGSGSDYAVFLHHLGVPILDLSFSGNSGGHYHTVFDDVAIVQRYLDPGFVGHELASQAVEALLLRLADSGPLALDESRLARSMAEHALETAPWLGPERAQRLATALEQYASATDRRWREWQSRVDLEVPADLNPLGSFASLRSAILGASTFLRADAERLVDRPNLLQVALSPEGLQGRPWYRNRLWGPDPSRGYGSETFPTLRSPRTGRTVDEELDSLLDSLSRRLGAPTEASASRR